MTTAYEALNPDSVVPGEAYLVLFNKEEVAIPFILRSDRDVSRAADSCESFQRHDRSNGHRNSYFLTKTENVTEIIPRPEITK